MKRPKIIVTGGTGYIGSHTIVCLIEQGYDVVAIDSLVNSNISVLDGISKITDLPIGFYQVDICDEPGLDSCLTLHSDAKAIIHFAALKSVSESIQKPLDYYQNNLSGLINLLRAMDKNGIQNLIFSSSATVYGEPDTLPVFETHPLKPALSAYGKTKKIGEDIIKDAGFADKAFNSILLRYFNPVGAHESGLIGEMPIGVPSNLMPFITQTAAGLREELLVFGDDYDTPDGTCIRDYIHVVDLAEAHIKAVERLLSEKQKKNIEIFNLGTGNGHTVLEVIKSFEKTSGLKLPYRITGRRSGDAANVYASTKLANEELGWKAKRNIDDMTRSSWKWEKHYRGI